MNDKFIGKRVNIQSNDFVGYVLPAHITHLDLTTENVLLRLESPLRVGAEEYLFVVARPRLDRDSLSRLIGEGTVSCNVTWVPNRHFNPDTPFDLQWWRGGAAVITDLILEN